MPAKPRICINCGVQQYHISWNDDEGEAADYGDPATLRVRGRTFQALVDEGTDENGEIERVTLFADDEHDNEVWAVETSPIEVYFAEYDEVEETGEDEPKEPEEDEDDDDGVIEITPEGLEDDD